MSELEIKSRVTGPISMSEKRVTAPTFKQNKSPIPFITETSDSGDVVEFTTKSNVQNKGEVIYNKDKNIVSVVKNGQKTNIDLNHLLRRVHNEEDKKYITDALLRMDPDALLDLSNEVSAIDCYRNSAGDHIGGSMDCNTNILYLNIPLLKAKNLDLAGTITHEVGHAVDSRKNSEQKEVTATNQEEFQKIFNEEVEAYKKKGFTKFDYGTNNKRGEKCIYASVNASEMYAEIYRLLHTKDINSDPELKALKQHFPKCIEFVRKNVEETRKLSKAKRNNPDVISKEIYSKDGKLSEVMEYKKDGRLIRQEKYDENGKAVYKKIVTYPEDVLRGISPEMPEEYNEKIREMAKKGAFVTEVTFDPKTGTPINSKKTPLKTN